MPMHSLTIHIANQRILFAEEQPTDDFVTIEAVAGLAISWAKIRKIVENDKSVAIISTDAHRCFSLFAHQFHFVEAAGGVVCNERDELLMIELRGRWDLPKGHVEVGETSAQAALREVEEETGIRAAICDQEPLHVTYHAYDTYGRWELKRTSWWRMQSLGGELRPQLSEGITAARWCNKTEVSACCECSYNTIKEVVAALCR